MREPFASTNDEIVIFHAPLRRGGELTLVQGEDDLCIKRNGSLVAGCFWRLSEMDKAINEFRDLVRRHDGHRHPGD